MTDRVIPKPLIDLAGPRGQAELYWHCECGNNEPAQSEYDHGDSEPCCFCDDGVARVVTIKEAARWEQAKALGNDWRPPVCGCAGEMK